ncbi:type III secretion system translocon subunit SctE [Pseudomonas sp. MWU13-3659]|uniref:type III secretion system translocon subunit SctE n=1 Tax=Pseudomonas sp. MWU13-3659 TaxID=2986964 RepID=UPI002075B7A3|nr:type III secretion system translocon subunit SctE [Pseudomonas sp. MWU13-3659]
MTATFVQFLNNRAQGFDLTVKYSVNDERVTLPQFGPALTSSDKVVPAPNVELDLPVAGADTPLTREMVSKLKEIRNAHTSIKAEQLFLLDAFKRAAEGTLSGEGFEIELAQLIGAYKKNQTRLSLEQILRQMNENKLQMDENLKKINEVNTNAGSAKKAGLFAKIFGWVASIVSVVVGLVLVCTGVGAAMGAAMMVGGALGIANMALQQAAEDGRISKETMKWLGPTLTGITLLVGVASAGIAFVPSLAASMSTVMQTVVQAIMVTSSAFSSASSLASTICNIQLLKSETAMAEMKLTTEQGQKILEQLTKRLQEMMEQNSELLNKVLEMLSANNKACQDASQRSAVSM